MENRIQTGELDEVKKTQQRGFVVLKTAAFDVLFLFIIDTNKQTYYNSQLITAETDKLLLVFHFYFNLLSSYFFQLLPELVS